MRVLTFTTLYPSAARPRHGIFVETRLRQLLGTGRLEAEVVAPVPWFPFRSERFGEYARYARTPRDETRSGIRVHHPRYAMLPGIGMWLQPWSIARAAGREIARLMAGGLAFDLIDAHYFYPDGVAAAALAKRFGKPFVVTARGSDINLIARLAVPGRMIRSAAARASAIVAVSGALKQALVECGVPGDRVTVLRNGVDLDLFRPVAREEARARLGLSGPLVASVGNLVREKGHDLAIRAVSRQAGVGLVIVGQGPQRDPLSRLATALRVQDRVHFRDEVPQDHLRDVYSAADAVLLGSSREGWPNVLLESLACGTPVVATDVGGVREIVADPIAGRVMATRDDAELGAALADLLATPRDRAAIRRYAEGFSWDAVSRGQLDLFAAVIAAGADRRTPCATRAASGAA